jgi:hypothetical protein
MKPCAAKTCAKNLPFGEVISFAHKAAAFHLSWIVIGARRAIAEQSVH